MNKEEVSSFLIEDLNRSLDTKIWEISLKEDTVIIKHRNDPSLGFNVSLSSVLGKLEQGKERNYLKESVRKISEMARASLQEKSLKGNEMNIYPVLRSASHPVQKQGVALLNREHTAESKIFYALDLGSSYVLIDQRLAKHSGYQLEEIHRLSINNLKKLDTSFKEDQVAGNAFYFFSQRDGYAASRILNDELLAFMKRKVEKDMALAIPHQDVLIIADIRNENGFKILSRLNMDFCVKGDVPISPLPFILTEDDGLEPIMVMANPGASPHIIRNNGEK